MLQLALSGLGTRAQIVQLRGAGLRSLELIDAAERPLERSLLKVLVHGGARGLDAQTVGLSLGGDPAFFEDGRDSNRGRPVPPGGRDP